MSTVCCLTMPLNHHSLTSPSFLLDSNDNREKQSKEVEEVEEENYSIILNQHLPSRTYSNNFSMPTRFLQKQKQQQPLLLVAEEAEILDIDNQNDNNKLLLPRSTRSLKRRTSLFEKSRDWARRLITLHRIRRNTISNEKIPETCYESNKRNLIRKNSYPESLHNYQKSFDEDGYLSPMEIKAKLDNISREKQQSLSKLSINPDQQLLIYSHSSSDISQPIYRCHGPINQTSIPPCTCQQQRLPSTSLVSEFHKSLSVVDYIDFDVSDESSLPKQDDDSNNHNDDDNDDPLNYLKYLFDDNNNKQQNLNFIRRTPRRSTNTSSISADSGYSDIPITSSKCIPIHLISCTLIPVNVTRTESMDIRCLTCTCPLTTSTSTYFSNKTERRRQRRQRKTSTHSQPYQTYSRQHMDIIENEINKHCSCNNKYYSTMTICPTLSLSSPIETKSITKIDGNNKDDYIYKQQQQQKKHLRKKRTSLIKLSTITDDLTSVSRWYKPNLERDAINHILQSSDYGAFILRNSTTHPDCYALSVKVPKFTHDSNIAHYLIEKISNKDNSSYYRIKGTIKQFPTLLSLLTHHSVMPEILPITLNLNEILPI